MVGTATEKRWKEMDKFLVGVVIGFIIGTYYGQKNPSEVVVNMENLETLTGSGALGGGYYTTGNANNVTFTGYNVQ